MSFKKLKEKAKAVGKPKSTDGKVRFNDIKKDEIFHFPGKKKVYVYQGGGPKRGND